MAQATFWFASPFKKWIGQRSLTLTWQGRITLREVWERLGAEYLGLRANLSGQGLQEEAMSHLVAVIVDGDILPLEAEIKDGATVDVLTPLSGGTGSQYLGSRLPARVRPTPGGRLTRRSLGGLSSPPSPFPGRAHWAK